MNVNGKYYASCEAALGEHDRRLGELEHGITHDQVHYMIERRFAEQDAGLHPISRGQVGDKTIHLRPDQVRELERNLPVRATEVDAFVVLPKYLDQVRQETRERVEKERQAEIDRLRREVEQRSTIHLNVKAVLEAIGGLANNPLDKVARLPLHWGSEPRYGHLLIYRDDVDPWADA